MQYCKVLVGHRHAGDMSIVLVFALVAFSTSKTPKDSEFYLELSPALPGEITTLYDKGTVPIAQVGASAILPKNGQFRAPIPVPMLELKIG